MNVLTAFGPTAEVVCPPSDIRRWFNTSAGLRFGLVLSCDRKDWSFKELYPGSEPDPSLPTDLARKLRLMNSEFAMLPRPGFNAKLGSARDLSTCVPVTRDNEMVWRNRDFPFDVLPLLHAGDTFAMSAGGCLLGVGAYKGELTAFHAGLESMIDPAFYSNTGATREHASVANTNLDYFQRSTGQGFDPGKAEFWMFGSIQPGQLVYHFQNGDHYRALARHAQRYEGSGVQITDTYVSFDLPKVLRHQLLDLGVSDGNIHINEEYTYLPDSYPHTRHKDRARRGDRYFAGIVRKR